MTEDLYPLVSVIMPVRNESAYIQHSLGAVLAQDYPSDRMEIIVADGSSTDSTRDIVRGFEREHPNLQLIDNPRRIVPTGLNAAILKSQGEIIIRVDGHCEIPRDYVRRCVSHLENGTNISGVGGAVITVGETYLAQCIAIAMSSAFGVGGSPFRTNFSKSILADSIPFPAYKKSIIREAGLFDEELVRNQDDEYNYRLRKLGANLWLVSGVHSNYYSRTTIRSLWRQYFQYGFWKVRVLQKHPLQMRPRQFVPLIFVLTLIGALLVDLFLPLGLPMFIVVFSLYLITNLIVATVIASQKGWRYLPLLPAVFFTIHLSYGLGFLIGLFRFIHRWGDKHGKVPSWPAKADVQNE